MLRTAARTRILAALCEDVRLKLDEQFLEALGQELAGRDGPQDPGGDRRRAYAIHACIAKSLRCGDGGALALGAVLGLKDLQAAMDLLGGAVELRQGLSSARRTSVVLGGHNGRQE